MDFVLLITSKNFYELRSKFGFSANGRTFSVIKFYLHLSVMPSPQSGAYVLEKTGDRWYQTRTTFTSEIVLMVMRFKAAKLGEVLAGRPVSDDLVNSLVSQVGSSGTIDLDRLYDVFNQWYTDDNKKMLDHFIDENAW